MGVIILISKESYVCDALASIYDRSLDDANNIICRAQNPLTALCLIIAMLTYMAQTINNSQIPQMSLENAPVIGTFYLSIIITMLFVIQTIYYLWLCFRPGGYTYKTFATPDEIDSLLKTPDSDQQKTVLLYLIKQFKNASQINIQNNKSRTEYIRIATERIILAVAFCFITGFLFYIITFFSNHQ